MLNDPVNLIDPEGKRPAPRPAPRTPPRSPSNPPFNPPRLVSIPGRPSVPYPIPGAPSDQGPIDRPEVDFLLCLIKGNCPPPKFPSSTNSPGHRKCTPGNPRGASFAGRRGRTKFRLLFRLFDRQLADWHYHKRSRQYWRRFVWRSRWPGFLHTRR